MLERPTKTGNSTLNDSSIGGGRSLGPILMLTFLASVSTGAVNNNVFFIAQEQYGFGRGLNLALALLVGAVYWPAALAAGPVLRRLAKRSNRVTTRKALVGLMVAMALACGLPVVAKTQTALWVFVVVYIPMMGALWPIVEAYLSGGRRGGTLRQAIGSFNLVWAIAVVAAAWGMAPMLGLGRPLGVFLGLGVVHLLCIVPVLRLGDEPPRHADESNQPHPESYTGLLRCFRWLLVLSYLLMAAISPIMPWRLDKLGLAIGWQLPMFSAWMVSRVAMFWLLQRWGGWHGRWRTPAWSGSLLVAGFLGVFLTGSVPAVIASLMMFGVGVGTIYAAGLYYAMEVGGAEVYAGGKHEAMIGIGYTIGPGLGLVALAIASQDQTGDAFAQALSLLTGLVAIGFVAGALISANRAIRNTKKQED